MEIIQKIIHAITQVHPPHIMFVHFPIGLAGGAAFFILLAVIFKKEIFEKIAFADISLAAVSAIIAGAMGIRDNLHFFNGNAPYYKLKIILGIILFVITAATALLRWRYPNLFHVKTARVFYILAYLVSFPITIALGFLGGVIVFGGL